jgi:1-phosphofructokinase family hexose kinase
MFDRIVTLSLNPAIDITLWVDEVLKNSDNFVRAEKYEAGGKAVNISRALSLYGVDNLAVVLAGRHNQERYESRLRAEGIRYSLIPVEGYTRENISVVQQDRTVTRFLREGFTVPYEVVEELTQELSQLVREGTLVVISGTLPGGISVKTLKNICRHVTQWGGMLAVDVAADITMEDVAEIGPWMIKPNRKELSEFTRRELTTNQEIIDCCLEMNRLGVENCLVSMGYHGIIYTGPEGVYQVDVPDVNVVSAVGSGDYCLAGFLMGRATGGDMVKALKTAAAFGTAVCLTEGTEPPTRLATANILQQVCCERLG